MALEPKCTNVAPTPHYYLDKIHPSVQSIMASEASVGRSEESVTLSLFDWASAAFPTLSGHFRLDSRLSYGAKHHHQYQGD